MMISVTDPPTLEDVLASTPGDAFAVRAETELGATILAGRIERIITTEPEADVAELRASAANDITEETPVVVAVVALDPTLWWSVFDDDDKETVDQSDKLVDRPPAQPYLAEPPEEPPPCSISLRDSGRLGLTIPGPVLRGSRVAYYAPDDAGELVAYRTGSMVDPRRLLADDEPVPETGDAP